MPSYRLSPRYSQANFPRDVLEIDVAGPYAPKGPGNTESRRRIFTCHPQNPAQEPGCARRIITSLAHRAYRRPVTPEDLAPLNRIYAAERKGSDFEHSIEAAVEAVLVSPHFLFLVEQDPAGSRPGTVRRLTDLELASRLSFFLWSSIPDEALLAAAEKGQLHQPTQIDAQITRMLADPSLQMLDRIRNALRNGCERKTELQQRFRVVRLLGKQDLRDLDRIVETPFRASLPDLRDPRVPFF